MIATLIPRLIDQANAYKSFALTPDEALDLFELLRNDPHAALHLGAGRIITLSSVPVHVLFDP